MLGPTWRCKVNALTFGHRSISRGSVDKMDDIFSRFISSQIKRKRCLRSTRLTSGAFNIYTDQSSRSIFGQKSC